MEEPPIFPHLPRRLVFLPMSEKERTPHMSVKIPERKKKRTFATSHSLYSLNPPIYSIPIPIRIRASAPHVPRESSSKSQSWRQYPRFGRATWETVRAAANLTLSTLRALGRRPAGGGRGWDRGGFEKHLLIGGVLGLTQ